MILYFSGTGNSRYVAEKISKITDDSVISINEILKSKNKDIIESEKPFVFVCPTYAWRIPRVVEDFIREANFKNAKEAYFILTCGGETGEAVKYIKKLCIEKGITLKGFTSVIMPDNYIVMYDTPDEEKANKIIEGATEKISYIAECIKDGKELEEEKSKLGGSLKSGLVNSLFYSAFVKSKGFYSTNKCISCGKCAKLCPLNNISIVEGRPQWGANCT
ncbi:MAG: EFR1 family ferrodoxin, partial [Clostridium baratii]|nr:EFR1 family ferrodoxin [Clostridium baratii]